MAPSDETWETLNELFHTSPEIPLGPEDRYVIFSDFHLGAGGASDDFRPNAELCISVLQWYHRQGHTLILNGDIEEILRHPLQKIQRAWEPVYRVFDLFASEGRLIKLVGNHDIDLLDMPQYPLPLQEAVRFNHKGNTIFVFHGHQMSRKAREHNPALGFVLKYLANPLRIKNYSLRNHSTRRFKVEKAIYHFSARQRILSIIGHTHRPLFESMSKYDSLRFEIERLCRKYPSAGAKRQREIRHEILLLRRDLEELQYRNPGADYQSSLYNESLVVPCMFNSGTVIGKRGMTCLELDRGTIALMHWFREGQSLRHRERPDGKVERVGDTLGLRRVVKSDSLDNVFTRIELLGGIP